MPPSAFTRNCTPCTLEDRSIVSLIFAVADSLAFESHPRTLG